jgi:hypothetical protein
MTLNMIVANCLQANRGKWMSAREIARWLVTVQPEKWAAKRERSKRLRSTEDLVSQLRAEIAAGDRFLRKLYPEVLVRDDQRPRRYQWPACPDSTTSIHDLS